jgi:superfamily I DNA/RNA helicase
MSLVIFLVNKYEIPKLKLLSGDPIDIGLCIIYPLTLCEVKDVGENEYNSYISCLLTGKSSIDYTKIEDEELLDEINKSSNYDFLVSFASQDNNLKNLIEKSLSFFLKESVKYHGNGFFYIGKIDEHRIINSDAFELIKSIIKQQNYIQDEEEKPLNPHNEKAKQLIEKMKEVKSQLKKSNKEEGLHLSDIISIVSNYSNDINILTVWSLYVYQLYEIYIRLIMWDNYHNNHLLLPHVSDQKSLDLKHWARTTNIK